MAVNTSGTAFGNALREALRQSPHNQTDLAKHLGVSRQAVSKYVTGEREPKPNQVMAIEVFLDRRLAHHLGYASAFDAAPPPSSAAEAWKQVNELLERMPDDVRMIRSAMEAMEAAVDDNDMVNARALLEKAALGAEMYRDAWTSYHSLGRSMESRGVLSAEEVRRLDDLEVVLPELRLTAESLAAAVQQMGGDLEEARRRVPPIEEADTDDYALAALSGDHTHAPTGEEGKDVHGGLPEGFDPDDDTATE